MQDQLNQHSFIHGFHSLHAHTRSFTRCAFFPAKAVPYAACLWPNWNTADDGPLSLTAIPSSLIIFPQRTTRAIDVSTISCLCWIPVPAGRSFFRLFRICAHNLKGAANAAVTTGRNQIPHCSSLLLVWHFLPLPLTGGNQTWLIACALAKHLSPPSPCASLGVIASTKYIYLRQDALSATGTLQPQYTFGPQPDISPCFLIGPAIEI